MTLYIIFIILLFRETMAVIYSLSEEEYSLMPPVFQMDAYESCLHQPGGLYCAVDLTLVSDTPSSLLEMIHNYSAQTVTHFNHSKLLHGICVTRACKKYLNQTTSGLKVTLEACLNQSMWDDYQLKTKVDDFSCHKDDESLDIDITDIVVSVICLMLVMLNVVGSLYDVYGTTGEEGQGIRFFLCFSVRRNWRRLTARPSDHPDPRIERLKGLNFVRTISTTFVLLAHSGFPIINFVENTRFIEQDFYEHLSTQLFVSGSLLIQVFLIMSAILLVYNLQKSMEKKNLNWMSLPKGIMLRWLRLTPPYAFVLALSATWLRHIGDGPFKMKYADKEALDCRRNWWYHLLYINNYHPKSECMVHTWYLAVDTQLYILGIIIWLTCRNVRTRKVVLPLLFLLGLVFTSLHVYFEDLDATLISSPENIRTFFVNDSTSKKVYILGYTNMSGYILGLAAGYLIYHWQMTGLDVKKYKILRYLYWATVPIGLGVIFIAFIFYADGPRLSITTRLTYAILSKPIFGIAAAYLFIGMVLKFENTYRAIMEWEGWTCPGRVSYSAYLIHIAIFRFCGGTQKYTMKVSFASGPMMNIYLFLAFLAAYPFWLVVEAPLNQLVKLCFSPKSTKTDVDCEKNGRDQGG